MSSLPDPLIPILLAASSLFASRSSRARENLPLRGLRLTFCCIIPNKMLAIVLGISTVYQVTCLNQETTCLNSSAVSYLDRNATLVSDATIEIRNIRDLVFIRAGPGNNKRFLDDHFYSFSSVEVSFDFSLHLFLPAFHFLSLSVQQSSLGLNRPEEIQNGVLQKLGGNIFTAINKTDKDSDMYELFQR